MSQKAITALMAGVVSLLALVLLAGCPPNAFHVLTLRVTPADGGYIVADPDRTAYFAGTEITLEAVPNEGYAFLRWDGMGINTNANPTKKRIYSDEIIVAVFSGAGTDDPVEGEDEAVVKDGGFEAGAESSAWTAWSATNTRILCSLDTCETLDGIGAAGGTHWAWFGNDLGAGFESSALLQQITMPAGGDAYLTFNMAIPRAEMDFTFQVLLDAVPLWEFNEADAAAYAAYDLVSLDISDFADGTNAVLTFAYFSTGSAASQSAVFVDNVVID